MNKLRKFFSDYVHGNSTKEEKEIIDLWFEEKAKTPVELVSDEEAEQFSQRIWKEFFIYGGDTKRKSQRNIPVVYGVMGVAAVILLLILLRFPFGHWTMQDGDNHGAIETSAVRQFVTDDNMKRITLPDGSIIHMNKGTTVELQKGHFNAYIREVWLKEGEAFFEVTKDSQRPFIVHLQDGLSARVLGTSFNIKAYSQLGEQVVSVKNGRVQVAHEVGESVVLDKNHKASFHTVDRQLTSGVTDGEGAADWRSGRIVLEHVTMKELAFRLKQYYGVDVVNNAVLEKMEIYTTFHVDSPLEHVLSNVASIFGISYKIENNIVYFY